MCDTRLVIRPYIDDDLGEVLDAWYRASVVAHSFLNEDFFDEERERLAEMWLPESDTSVFEVDARVVGFVSMVGNEVGGPGHVGCPGGWVQRDQIPNGD